MSAAGPLCAPASGLRRREQRHYPKLRDAAGLIRSRDRARGEGAAER
jgi:predicted trehalose synthase